MTVSAAALAGNHRGLDEVVTRLAVYNECESASDFELLAQTVTPDEVLISRGRTIGFKPELFRIRYRSSNGTLEFSDIDLHGPEGQRPAFLIPTEIVGTRHTVLNQEVSAAIIAFFNKPAEFPKGSCLEAISEAAAVAAARKVEELTLVELSNRRAGADRIFAEPVTTEPVNPVGAGAAR